MLLASLAETERMCGLPDFIRQLYQNTALESHEVPTAQAMLPVPQLASDDSEIPLSSIIDEWKVLIFALSTHSSALF